MHCLQPNTTSGSRSESKLASRPEPSLDAPTEPLAPGQPLVSIGLPVFNEEHFIAETLRSLCNLDYANIEIIVSDNASTDETPQICAAMMKEDRRIRYFRNEANLGASVNFERVLELARGKYFMWAGAHDRRSPSFVSRCVAALESDEACVLVYPAAQWIDSHGRTGKKIPSRMNLLHESIFLRILLGLWLFDYHAVYGIYQTEIVRFSSFKKGCLSPDWLLVLEVAARGKVRCIPDILLEMRQGPEYANWKAYFLKLQLDYSFFSCIRLVLNLYKNMHDLCRRHIRGLWGWVASKIIYLVVMIRTGWFVATLFVELSFPHARDIWLGMKRKV